MKKVIVSMIVAAAASNVADATVLFPFYSDIAPDNKVVARIVDEKKFEQVVRKGDSGWGDLQACESFLDDVVPDDVSKGKAGNMVVYTSTFHDKEIDTIEIDNKVSAIYILDKGDKTEVFYSESDGIQQKEWQAAITAGEL
ncbi:MAG: hypothetical protein ACI30W_07535 [Muribaculaceae bacterium]